MLDSTAKLSDIITELQNLEGINQKEDLKSALVAKGISVSDTDNMADLISKLNSASTKRWASGTVTTDSSGSATVSGLTFTPSKIIIYGSTNNHYHNNDLLFASKDADIWSSISSVNCYQYYYNGSGSYPSTYSATFGSNSVTVKFQTAVVMTLAYICYE